MWNIIVGAVFLIGGLSGKLAIRGTDSTMGASIVGGCLIAWGLFQVLQGSKKDE